MSRAFLPIPDDFAQHVHETDKALAERYGYNPRTIASMRKRAGVPPSTLMRAPPADLAAMHAKHGRNALSKHYRCGDATLMRWLVSAGLYVPAAPIPVPDWWAVDAPKLLVLDAAARAGVGKDTVHRWEKATGVLCIRKRQLAKAPRRKRKPKQPVAVREKSVEFCRSTPTRTSFKPKGATLRTASPQRDMTRAGQAADHLRRLDPVRRCDASGEYAQTGDHWHFRGRVYDAAGIIERAERAGFDPDAWARIAA